MLFYEFCYYGLGVAICVCMSGLYCVVLTHEYPIIWVSINLTYLLNGTVVLTYLLDFIKKQISINQIDMNYEKPKQINIFNINFRNNE